MTIIFSLAYFSASLPCLWLVFFLTNGLLLFKFYIFCWIGWRNTYIAHFLTYFLQAILIINWILFCGLCFTTFSLWFSLLILYSIPSASYLSFLCSRFVQDSCLEMRLPSVVLRPVDHWNLLHSSYGINTCNWSWYAICFVDFSFSKSYLDAKSWS